MNIIKRFITWFFIEEPEHCTLREMAELEATWGAPIWHSR